MLLIRLEFKYSWPLVLILLSAFCQLNHAEDQEDNGEHYEMPFPNLFEDFGRRVHIVSEVYDYRGGYSTREDFVDLSAGKATFIVMKSNSRETYHMDAATLSSYYYVPYECYPFKFPQRPTGLPAEGFWINEQITGVGADEGEAKKMYLTGVAAVWANAKNLPKTYSTAASIYSASKDVYQPAHKWEMKLGDSKASFYFHETSDEKSANEVILTIEAIEIEIGDGRKFTITVLEYDNVIEDLAHREELSLPLGYGCLVFGELPEDTKKIIDQAKQLYKFQEDNLLKLEAVATKRSNDGERSTDTVNLEFIRSRPYDSYSMPDRNLQLFRQRNSKLDIRQVIDHELNVMYEIDERQGTCSMASLGRLLPVTESKMDVKFSNGLGLRFNNNDLHALFYGTDNYALTKLTDEEDGVRFLYLTMTTNLFSRIGKERIVRKYSIRDQSMIRLESATVWILDDSQSPVSSSSSTIKETYHFTVIESSRLNDESKLARAFDVSQECYIESENTNGMKYGRDFAWIKLHYNAPHYLFNMRPHPISLHGFYYSMRYYSNIWYLRIPRLELMFEEVGFSVRMLLLDSPPLHMIFDRTEGKAIQAQSWADGTFFTEIAPDLRHCAELCRLHRCEAFSFSASSFSCILADPPRSGSDRAKFISSLPVISRAGCTLFTVPMVLDYPRYLSSKLHNFIGQLQTYDLTSAQIPEMPEELYDNRNGFGDELGKQLWKEYYGKVGDYLKSNFWHPVTFFVHGLFAIVPDRFEVELDPLAEFGLDGRDELELDDDSQVPAFHEGFSAAKFNRMAFKEDDGKESNKDDKTAVAVDKRPESRRYVGVDFEQCQLACLDGKCSSFSFCRQRQECTITNLWDLQADGGKYIAPDSDCAILQRDFLSKFHKLTGVVAPRGKPVEAATNAAECAHVCVAVSGSSACLAFTFCPTTDGGSGGGGQCYYSTSRSLDSSQVVQSGKSTGAGQCDHYSRSYLADFTRIEYRQIQPEALEQLKTSRVEGKSVDSCAEMCATELMDCTAFQFCYDPESAGAEAKSGRQVCTLIESPPREKQDDFRVELGEGGKVIKAGKMFANNPNCHVFSLRKGSSEAELRQLALNPLEKDEGADENSSRDSSRGLSLAGGFLLFVCCTFVFTVMGIALLAAQRNNESVRTRIDRLRAMYGRY